MPEPEKAEGENPAAAADNKPKPIDVTFKAREVLKEREEALALTARSEKKIEEARRRRDAAARKVASHTITPVTLVSDVNSLHPVKSEDKKEWQKQWNSTDPSSVMASYEQLGSAVKNSRMEERKGFLEGLKKREVVEQKRQADKAREMEEQKAAIAKSKEKEAALAAKVAAQQEEEMKKLMEKHQAKMEKGQKLAEDERKKREERVKTFNVKEEEKSKTVLGRIEAAKQEHAKKMAKLHAKNQEKREAKGHWAKEEAKQQGILRSSMDRDATLRNRNERAQEEFEQKCYEERYKLLTETQARADAALKAMEDKAKAQHEKHKKVEDASKQRLEKIWKEDDEKSAAWCAKMAKRTDNLNKMKAAQADQARERQERQREMIRTRAAVEDLLLTAQITKKVDPFNTLQPVPPPED